MYCEVHETFGHCDCVDESYTPSMDECDLSLVFVYGTLKQGFCNHDFLDSSRFIGKGMVRGAMINIGSYPGFLPPTNPADTRLVWGEVYEVDNETLANLDWLEGSRYTRKDLPVRLAEDLESAGNNDIRAFVYCWNRQKQYPTIQSGVWI